MSHEHAGQPGRAAAGAVPCDPLRPPAEVMRLARMGALHQTRISFLRSLVRRMAREEWHITRQRFDIAGDETGEAVYTVDTPAGRYSFVVFAEQLAPDERSDRVIAERWDYTFALCEGEPDTDHMANLRANVPRQEAGRLCSRDLVLSRGNKSVRLFDYIVGHLASGLQPRIELIARVGYLMRTTAVYGNGKFGLADYVRLCRQGAFPQPFSAQMLTVYLARVFSLDLVDHLARLRSPDTAVPLAPHLRRAFGVGNATGLGMAPFIVSHPRLIHQWAWARETAIARVKAVRAAGEAEIARVSRLLHRAIRHVGEWETSDPRQHHRNRTLLHELRTLRDERFSGEAGPNLPAEYPWRALCEEAAARFGLETQEMLHSLILEPYPHLVDGLEEHMAASEEQHLRPTMPLAELKRQIETDYAWALEPDYDSAEGCYFFWYRSETKEEPRLGVRGEEPGEDREMAIGIGREVARLHAVLAALPGGELRASTAEFLMRRPELRAIVRRVQTLADLPYAEVHDNLVGRDCLPIDLLRFKLSFFGAVKFDPKSDRWTRITLFQGAPLPEDLRESGIDPDDWFAPVMPDE